MTLPVDALKRRTSSAPYDVIIVGAGIAGLVCGAMLARAGRRAVIVDRAKRPGGRLQTLNYQGFAVDLGPPLWDAPGLREVLSGAGVEDPGLAFLASRDAVRLAIVGEDERPGRAWPLPVPGAVPSPSTLDAVRALYDVPPRVFAALGEVYGELAAASAEQLEAWRATTVGEWAKEREIEAPVAQALARSAVLLGADDGNAASMGALASSARVLAAGSPLFVASGDNPIAGARGVVQALVDAHIEAGGELKLGTRAVGIGLDNSNFAVLGVKREEAPFHDELEAERCVLTVPSAELVSLLPGEARSGLERFLPEAPPVRELGVAWALRSEAPPEENRGSAHVVVRLVPAPRAGSVASESQATLVWSSALAPRIVPSGHALVRGSVAIPAALVADARELTRKVERLRSALIALQPDAADAIEWERFWVSDHPTSSLLQRAPLPNLAPACGGVLLASEEVSIAGSTVRGITGAALAGRAAAERILAA